MDDPVKDIAGVVHKLTQGTPSEQQNALEAYFTQDAAFLHPFVRVPHFRGSRAWIHGIFRWYKIMSPHIDISINSIAFDAAKLILYLDMTQDFRVFIIPFYKAPVHLVTVLQLEKRSKPDSKGNSGSDVKYYIRAQNDLYQTDQFVRFVWPGGFLVVRLWQLVATLCCYAMATLFWPITYIEETHAPKGWYGLARK